MVRGATASAGIDGLRCTECRQKERRLAELKKRYEALFQVDCHSLDETLEMAECCLTLVEAGVFHPRQRQHVRQLLNAAREGGCKSEAYAELRGRWGRSGSDGDVA